MLKSNKRLDGVCRACLGPSVNRYISIQTENVKELFQSCSGLKIKEIDLLPKFLCQSCYTKCNEWKIFKKLCESSEKYLIKIISKETQISKVEDVKEDLEDNFSHTNLPITVLSSIETVSCLICDKQFVGEKQLLEHQIQQHTVQISQQKQLKFLKIYQCRIGQNVPNKHDGLKKHVRNFSCRICEKSFLTNLALTKHKVTHSGENNFVCHECDKQFLTSAGLNEHRLSHTDLRPLECTNFGKE